MREPSTPADTHPSLSERLGALSQSPLPDDAADVAGEMLLGESWPRILEEFNAKWARDTREDWRVEHLKLSLMPAEKGLAELERMHLENPGDGRAAFCYAEALLRARDRRGVPILESLARAQPVFRAQAFVCGARYYERIGDSDHAARWNSWLGEISGYIDRAIVECMRKAEAGDGRPTSLPAAGQELIRAAARGQPCVAEACLLEAEESAVYSVDKPPVAVVVHFLVLVLDPQELERRNQHEDHLVARFDGVLQKLVPPGQYAVVRKHFTTETLPEGYRAHTLVANIREEEAQA